MTSVNTNYGALIALQNLNTTNRQIGQVQNRINTGLRVSNARDDGATYAIAQGQRARGGTIDAVRRGIDRANVVIDNALTAGGRIGDVLTELRAIAEEGTSDTFSQEQRDALQTRFASLRSTIDSIAGSATFNGANLINGTNTAQGLRVATSDISGTTPNTLTAAVLNGGNAGVIATSASTIAQATGATVSGAVDQVNFTLTSGGSTTSFDVAVAATDTVQQFVDRVATATGGRITAAFNASTGAITYSSNDAFTVTAQDNTGAAVDDDAFFDNADGTAGTALAGGATATGRTTTVAGYDFRTTANSGTANATNPLAALGALNISSVNGSNTAITAIDAAITRLNSALADIGADGAALDAQNDFLSTVRDQVDRGIGQLVDADLTRESARFQALQVKQQLGAQALGLANQQPQLILSLFG